MTICFVIPVCNERETLEELTAQIAANAGDNEYRIWFIDDGSTDGSREMLDRIAEQNPDVHVHHFPKNRGKTAALAKGFELASGDVVITIDSDLQDDPKEIPRFLAKIQEGYDLVCGWKIVRNDPWHKRLPSKLYNWFVCRAFGLPLHDVNCGYKAMRLEVAKSLHLEHDFHRLIPVLAKRNGYSIAELKVAHHPRRYGHSKYGIARFWTGARDVFRLLLRRRK